MNTLPTSLAGNREIGVMVRVFESSKFNPRSSHTKIQKMVLDGSLINTAL